MSNEMCCNILVKVFVKTFNIDVIVLIGDIWMFLTSYCQTISSIGQSIDTEKIILFRSNELEAQWAELVSLTFHSVLRKLYTEPFIGASYQIAVHLATQFQRRFFRNQPIRNKNCL